MISLEFSKFINISSTFFPKSLIFLETSFSNYLLFKNLLLKGYGFSSPFLNNFYKLKRDLLNVADSDWIQPLMTVDQNLSFLAKVFKASSLKMTPVSFFQMDLNLLNFYPHELTEEQHFLISLAPLFYKPNALIWLFEIPIQLSQKAKDALQNLVSSKISNSESIIFYASKLTKLDGAFCQNGEIKF